MRFASARCRTPRENRLCSKRSKPHPPHTRGTIHRRLQPLYTEKHKVSCSGFLPKTNPMQQSCSHYNAICIHTLQNTKGEPITLERVQAALAAHTRYLSSLAAATLHGITQGFVLRLPHQNTPHATVMQPLQCVLQLHVPIHAAITMRFASTRCRTPRENRLCSKRSKPHPPHTRGTIHCRLQPLYTEKDKVSCSGFLPKTNPMQQSCSHYNAICIHTLQNTKGEPITLERVQAAPAAHTRYLSSLAAATLHGKTQGFVPRLPPQNKPHATVMQPLQCVLQLHVPIHAAITMRFASTRCRTPRENRLCSKRSKPHPPHTRGTVHRWVQPLYTEKRKVSCSGFLPKTNPMQQSCSHYNAFCSYTYPSMQPLQCDFHPHVAEHQGRTDYPRKGPSCISGTHEVPFIAGRSHFTRKNTRFRAPASSPKQTPCNSHAAITMRFAATRTHPSSHYNAICIPASLGHHFC